MEEGVGRMRAQRAGAALGNLALLVVVHLWPRWLPLTHGVVTDAFAQVVWVLDLSLGLQVVGNALLVAWPRGAWLRGLVDLMSSAVGLLSLAVVISVFPFDFRALVAPWFDLLVRGVLTVALLGVAIAIVVQLVTFLVPVRHPR